MGRKKKIFKDASVKKQKEQKKDESLTFTEALRSFQTRNMAKNLSEKTQKWYTEEITMLAHWLEEKNYSTKVSQISYDVLLQYILYLSTEKLGHNGKKLHISVTSGHPFRNYPDSITELYVHPFRIYPDNISAYPDTLSS